MKADDSVRVELANGERLLWSGRPPSGVRLRSQDLLLIPFSLLWAGFAVFWEASVLTTGAPDFFVLWGVPFVAIGAYITVGRFFVDAWQRARTSYGLTDQRILIISGLANRQVKSLPLRNLNDVSVKLKADATGTITFGSGPPMYAWFGGSGWPGMGKHMPPSFEMIANARTVYEAIRTAIVQLHA